VEWSGGIICRRPAVGVRFLQCRPSWRSQVLHPYPTRATNPALMLTARRVLPPLSRLD
jgi:hypothetical protein